MVFVKSEGSPLLPGGSVAKTRGVKWTAAAVLLCACVIVVSVASFKPAVDAIKSQQQMTELMGASRLAADDAEIDAIADKVFFTRIARAVCLLADALNFRSTSPPTTASCPGFPTPPAPRSSALLTADPRATSTSTSSVAAAATSAAAALPPPRPLHPLRRSRVEARSKWMQCRPRSRSRWPARTMSSAPRGSVLPIWSKRR